MTQHSTNYGRTQKEKEGFQVGHLRARASFSGTLLVPIRQYIREYIIQGLYYLLLRTSKMLRSRLNSVYISTRMLNCFDVEKRLDNVVSEFCDAHEEPLVRSHVPLGASK